jgi:hypothetical protein
MSLNHPSGNRELVIALQQPKTQPLPLGKPPLEDPQHPDLVDSGDASSQLLQGLLA